MNNPWTLNAASNYTFWIDFPWNFKGSPLSYLPCELQCGNTLTRDLCRVYSHGQIVGGFVDTTNM